jgi:hypothetical protein
MMGREEVAKKEITNNFKRTISRLEQDTNPELHGLVLDNQVRILVQATCSLKTKFSLQEIRFVRILI